MNAPKWPGSGDSYGEHRLLGVSLPPRAFDFGAPAPRGGWPEAGTGSRAGEASRPMGGSRGARGRHVAGAA
jgi:hypothetical protein